MNEDRFMERLRDDARKLRYDAGDAAVTRVAARVRERVAQPTIAELIAGWIRPLAASLTALVLAATIGLTVFERGQAISWSGDSVEVTLGSGDVFSVAE